MLKVSVGIIALLLLVVTNSCIKDEIDLENVSDKIYWNPKLGFPVAYGSLTLEDLVDAIDSTKSIREDQNKFLTLVYTNNVLSSSAASILRIDNQHFSEVLLESQYNLPPFPTQDTIVLNRNSDYAFSFSQGEVIDSVHLKGGTLLFNVSSTYKYRGSLKITVPMLVKNKMPLVINVDINQADGTFTSSRNIDLTGYKFELEHPNGNDNILSYNYTAKLVNTGAGVSIGDNISISIDFNNLAFSSLFGYIGQRQLLNTQSDFSIPMFQNITQPDLRFRSPLIRIRTSNSFGLPASIELYNTRASNDINNQSVLLTFSPTVNPFQVSYPSAIGISALDTVVFNNQTSNLNDALAIGPNHLTYGIRSTANPGARVYNYVTDTSKLSVDMDVELPLDMSTSLVEFTDTMDADFSDLKEEDAAKVKSLLLHTTFDNGMPVDLNLQVYFLDENYLPVDTLFNPEDDNVIKSASVDQQGMVTSPTKKDIDIQYSQSQIKALTRARYALIKAGIVTANGGNTLVKFYSNYTIKVYFGLQTELEIKE